MFVLAPQLEAMPRRVSLSFACLCLALPSCLLLRMCARLLHHLCTVCFPVCITCEQPWCSTQFACAVCSGTKRERYLTENVKAFHVKLTPEDKAALEAIFHQEKVTACFHLGRPVRLLGAVQDNVNAWLLGVAQAFNCGQPQATHAGRHVVLGQGDNAPFGLALWHCALLSLTQTSGCQSSLYVACCCCRWLESATIQA